jgi:hypothetical protein
MIQGDKFGGGIISLVERHSPRTYKVIKRVFVE